MFSGLDWYLYVGPSNSSFMGINEDTGKITISLVATILVGGGPL